MSDSIEVSTPRPALPAPGEDNASTVVKTGDHSSMSNMAECGASAAVPSQNIRKGQVIQRGYVLNDTGALKKKLRHESRKEAFTLGVEARDGSNMVIEMKTSFFEYMKSNFINDVTKKDGIESIENAVAAKAQTESSGNAFVEFSLDIGFKVLDKILFTKLTAYTTSCRVLFQPMGSTPQMKALLGNKSVPRFFVDNYFLPWCEEVSTKKNFDEKKLLDDIREEIKRLDMIKLEAKKARKEGRLTSVSSPEVRCVAKVCKYTGLNSSNKSAVGICAKCGGFEHYECSKTKQETRDDIQRGEAQYFCSVCFLKNPSFIAFEASKPEKKQISPALGIIQVTSKVKAIPTAKVSAPPSPRSPERRFKCTSCEYVSHTEELLTNHEEEVHSSNKEQTSNVNNGCKESNTSVIPTEELSNQEETIIIEHPCTKCEETFTNANDHHIHMENEHSTKCPLCTKLFIDNDTFIVHMRNEHAPFCDTCEIKFITKEELEEHIENKHTTGDQVKCKLCDSNFPDLTKLETHTLKQHKPCTWCEDILVDEADLQNHVILKHSIKCSICNITANTDLDMEKHILSVHNISCPICGSKSETHQEFSKHFHENHIYRCQKCDKEFGKKEDLVQHIQQKHNHACTNCSETFLTVSELGTHTKEKHSFSCTVCDELFDRKQKLEDHIKEKHSFDCEKCDFKGISESVMETHILENHIYPDVNKEKHQEETNGETNEEQNDNNNKVDLGEVASLKEELKTLRNNFERLESVLQDSLEESSKIKSEYEAKLNEANDNLRVQRIENEELKEKVEVLFKLGRGYIDKQEKKQHSTNEINVDEIETVSVEEITLEDDTNVTNDDLQGWTRNKLRGFKRSSPTTTAEKNSSIKPSNDKNRGANNPPPLKPAEPTQVVPEKNNVQTERPKYCHYFSNIGKCIFEERTGGTCKFSHGDAPMCQRGASCTREKCMYKHPNLSGMRNSSSFLDQRKPRSGIFQNSGNINPWMMINPWWNPNQAYIPGPWNPNLTRQP